MTERELMILAALRYSIYRRSYMSGVCRREIRKEVDEGNLSQRAIAQAIHEINVCKKDHNKGLGHNWYGKKEWIELRDWLREKITDDKEIKWLKRMGDES